MCQLSGNLRASTSWNPQGLFRKCLMLNNVLMYPLPDMFMKFLEVFVDHNVTTDSAARWDRTHCSICGISALPLLVPFPTSRRCHTMSLPHHLTHLQEAPTDCMMLAFYHSL